MGSADQPLAASPVPPPAAPAEESLFRFVFFNDRELRAGWRLLLYFLIALVIAYVLGLLVRQFLGKFSGVLTPTFVIVQEFVLAVMVMGAAVVMGKFESRTLADYGLPVRHAFSSNFWLGAAWGIGSLTLVLLALRINGSFLFGAVGLGWKQALWYGALWALAMYLVGLAEEFMLRGYTQFTLTTGLSFWGGQIGFWLAAALLSLAFAGLHITNPGETPLGIANIVLIALFFCFTLYRTGSLWFAIGMHASWNWGQTFLYGVPNSGVPAQGHLLNPTIQGEWWYSGGTVGPEGSILMVPLVALMFVVFDRTFPKGARYPGLVSGGVSTSPVEPIAVAPGGSPRL
jgi:membrane protease YdiL (CAAX protease family)